MLVHRRAMAPGYSRHCRPAVAPGFRCGSRLPAKLLQAAPGTSGRRLLLPPYGTRVHAWLDGQQQPPAQYSQTLASISSAAAAAKLPKGAYLFEVSPDDPTKPQTFQTEQAMLARYNHLLKESGLMANLKARARFERPRDKAERRRQQRIEQHKWQRKQAGFVPESLESAGGPDMVLEEPYEDFFNLRAVWDTAVDPGEAPWEQQQAQQQEQQQRLDYGYYAYEPNNVVDLEAYMTAGGEAGAAEFGGYMAGYGPQQAGSSSSSSSGVAGGYSSTDAAAVPAGWGLEYVNPGSYKSMAAATSAIPPNDDMFNDAAAAALPGVANAAAYAAYAAYPTTAGGVGDSSAGGFFAGGYDGLNSAAASALQTPSWSGLVDLEQLNAAGAAEGLTWQQQQYSAWQQQLQQHQQALEQQQAAWQQQQQELWQQQQAMQDAAAAAAAMQQQVHALWMQQQQQQAEVAAQLAAAGQGVPMWMDEGAAAAAAAASSGFSGSAGWIQPSQAEAVPLLQQQVHPASDESIAPAAGAAAAVDLSPELIQQAEQLHEPVLPGTAAVLEQLPLQQVPELQITAEATTEPAVAAAAAAAVTHVSAVLTPPEAQPVVPVTAAEVAPALAAAPMPSVAEPAVPLPVDAELPTGVAAEEEAVEAQQADSAAAAAATPAAAVDDPFNTEETAAPQQQQQQQRRRRQPQARKAAAAGAAAAGKAAAPARPAAAGRTAASPKPAAAAATTPAAAAAAAEPREGQLTAAASAAALREAQAALDASMDKLQAVAAALAARGLQVAAPAQQQQQLLAGGSVGGQAPGGTAANMDSRSSSGRNASPGQFRRIGRKQQSEAAAGPSSSSSSGSGQARVRQGSKGSNGRVGGSGSRSLKGPIVLDGRSFTAAGAAAAGGEGSGDGRARSAQQKKAGAAGGKSVV